MQAAAKPLTRDILRERLARKDDGADAQRTLAMGGVKEALERELKSAIGFSGKIAVVKGVEATDASYKACYRDENSGATLDLSLARADAECLVEAAFGGSLQSEPNAQRLLTRLDRKALSQVCAAVSRAFAEAISRYAPEKPVFTPDKPSEESDAPLWEMTTTLQWGGGRTARMFLRAPETLLANAETTGEGAQKWRHDIGSRVRQSAVALTAALPAEKVALSTMARLRPGDLLPLRAHVDSQITLSADGAPVFLGRLGRENGALVVKVEEGKWRTPE